MDKIFGGPIVPTLFRLLILSFIVGLALYLLDVDPVNLWRDFGKTIRDAWTIVFDSLNWASQYAILGAIVVLPVWLIYRVILYVTSTKPEK